MTEGPDGTARTDRPRRAPDTPEDRPLLAVRGVSKSFGRLRAVDGLDLDVRSGEILGIAGPNGAGKSTLFNILTRVPFGADAGTVEFDGRSITSASPRTIVRAGLVRTFQTEAAFDTLSAWDNVRVAARYGGGDERTSTIVTLLDRVGLGHRRHEVARDLPLFAKKRLMIATALTTTPRLLLLDEPASGLNDHEQAELVDLIRGIHASGVTIVVIEHVLPLLHALAGRLVVMAAGRHLAEGPPAEVLRDDRVIEAYVGRRGAA